jgi:hypothetical protein
MSSVKPRHGTGFDKPGRYALVSRVSNTNVSPGDTVTLDLYITGYGRIESSKLYFSPPPFAIFDTAQSFLTSGLKAESVDPKAATRSADGISIAPGTKVLLTWGERTVPISEAGLTLVLGGMAKPGWGISTPFFDENLSTPDGDDSSNTPSISTEILMDHAPISIVLKLLDEVNPGMYAMNFVFTYYNGYMWENSNLQINLTIQNIFQRNERWVSTLGIMAALGSATGIVALGITVWQLLFN